MKVDVFCPVYFLNEYFETNVQSWFDAIPINTLWLGLGSKDKLVQERVYAMENNKTEIVFQENYKTLGYCLTDLASRVKTSWCVFVHDDVRLPTQWFERMWKYQKQLRANVLESIKEPIVPEYIKQAQSNRAYSGAQLIQKEMLKYMKFDDDYVLTTEDLIFQYRILMNDYIYCKVPVLHQHQGHNGERSMDQKELYKNHAMALIKYLPMYKDIKTQIISCLEKLHQLNEVNKN